MKQSATVSDLARLLAGSLEDVRDKRAAAPRVDEIESASFLVFQAMTSRSRDYHGLAHLFNVAAGLPALARLAAIYHDIVYFHVDGGFPPNVSERIGDVVERGEDGIFLAAPPDDMMTDLAIIFGFSPRQELINDEGLSEFLSAALAVRELQRFLSVKDLWTVAACIEATIPFREPFEGLTPDAMLGKRLESLRSGGTALTSVEIERIQILAVQMANADVQSFGQPDLSIFIQNTWQILAEINPELRNAGAYSLRSYREALVSMEKFLTKLDARVIFRRHGTTPSDDEFEMLIQCAESNMSRTSEYLRANIVGVIVLESLTELTGGDGPVSYFNSATDSRHSQIADLLSRAEISTDSARPPLDDMVLHVLKIGLIGDSSFNAASSQLVCYLYELLGTAGTAELMCRATAVSAGKRDWRWILAALPRDVVSELATALA